MEIINQEENLWVQRYRPQTVKDVILPSDVKNQFLGFIEKGEIPNLVLCSRQGGTGKTTSAKALCHDLNYDLLFINASLEANMDTLRNKMTAFVSSISLTGNRKVIALDESDGLNPLVQNALRAFLEKYSKNCRFIFTCNYVNKLLPQLLSRCTVIDFGDPSKEKKEMLKQILSRLFEILKAEKIEFDPKAVLNLLMTHYPDIRRVINELQRYASTGKIDSGIMFNPEKDNYSALIQSMKAKNFTEVRKWVSTNSDISDEKLFGWFYENCDKILVPSSVPQLVMSTAEYQYKSAFVADKIINVAAYLTEVMANCEFRND